MTVIAERNSQIEVEVEVAAINEKLAEIADLLLYLIKRLLVLIQASISATALRVSHP